MAGMYGCFKGKKSYTVATDWRDGRGQGNESSESAAMASGPPDVMANQEPAEVVEECSGKKKSKFQTFKKFFARKKRKEPSASGGEAGLKGSQSSDNVNKTPENTLTRSEKGSGSKVSLGSKALSHDSVFVSDSSEANEALGASQDSIHGKVKSLQLKQAIRLGSPPSLMCVKRMEDAGTMSEDDGLPCSPPEYSTLHTVLNQAQRSSLSLEGTDSDEDQLSCAASSRAVSPLVAVPGDFSQAASPFGCLDNSAAKHKMGLRHKACTKRKPASRLDFSTEGDSVVEERLSTSIPEASEESEEQETGEVSGDQLKPKEEEGEEEDEEEEADGPQHSKQSLLRDKEEEEEEEEGEDELEAGQDVSHGPEASSPLERCVSEEEGPDAQPLASSKPSSRASSLGRQRSTPEPPAGQREYLLDPSGIAYGMEENGVETDFALGAEEEEDGVLSNIGGEDGEEESSFLQEVLSSLKTPLTSHSLGLDTDSVVLEMKGEEEEGAKESEAEVEDAREVEEKDTGEGEIEEGEEVKEEEAEVDEPVSHQAPPSGSLPPLLGQPTQEEEVVPRSGTASSCPAVEKEEEDENVEEEDKEEEEEEEEEEVVVERFRQHGQEEEGEKDEVQEVKPECCAKDDENDLPVSKSAKQEEEEEEEEGEEGESEGEEEAIELEKEPEVEEEGREKREEEEEKREEKERVEEAEEAVEEEEDDDVGEITVLDATGGMVGTDVPVQEADEGLDAMLGEDQVFTPECADQDQIPAEPCDRIFTNTPEGQAAFSQSSVDERDDGEERPEEGVEIGKKSDQEEDFEGNQPDADQKDGDQEAVEIVQVDEEQVGIEISDLDMNHPEEDQRDVGQQDQTVKEQVAVSFRPSSLSLPESKGFSETQTQDDSETSIPTTPSTTTTLHINLVSPSSEKATSPLQQSLSGADTSEEVNESSSPAAVTAEQDTGRQSPAGEEPADAMEEEELGKESSNAAATAEEEEAQPASNPPAAATEEAVLQPSGGSDPSKVRFTIAPAWQRSLSTGGESPKEPVAPASPSSPPPCASSVSSSTSSGGVEAEVEVEAKKEPLAKAEPASSVKAEVVLSPGRPRSAGSITAKAQTSTAATGEESPVLVEGNPENPFGVRLRKTAVLHRYGSEEENTEPAPEPPAQPTGSKVDPPQPISVKPSISQPISNKPALPRKPELQGDSGVKTKRTPDPAAGRGASGSDSPSWISVARQKQKIYKDNSLDETTVKKEEPERKSSLPLYVSSAACREHSKTPESTGKVNPLELAKPAAPVEKEARRSFSPPTPVPPQPPKPQSLPCPVAPKPSPQRALSPPTPVPVPQRPPSCTGPPSVSKPPPPHPAPSSKTPQSSSAPPVQRPPAQPSQRGLPTPGSPPPASPQDEPPWMALAKKKAKAWSEMPQIVQ
ncbi:capping protein-inhibiting regulator of actin dynamics isoform X2 [Centroberyx affinis]|uniref:capping protein-inhibiting regulator of actin dynamics isoform X2 n=1 Tax=Centroberyx affinis TaxID=166261 RepID=UPI003A5C58B8